MERNFKYFLPVLSFLLLLAACEKTDVTPEFKPSRLFSPGEISITSGETRVTVEWGASLFTEADDVQYTVEVSQDTLFPGQPLFSEVVDTSLITITDDKLELKQKYFARIKANGQNGSADSKWVTTKSFSITGEQIFTPVSDASVNDKSVLLKWRSTPDVNKIVLTPDGGTPIEVALDAADVTAAEKQITGLQANTGYTATIYSGAKLKGTVTFRTKEPSKFTYKVNPTADLNDIITKAANNDVIGLEPGEYDISALSTIILKKHITLMSVSGNNVDTKVKMKEFSLTGDGAGLHVSGISFNVNNNPYFINMLGETANGAKAAFTSITIDNCEIFNISRCLIRGSQGSAANDHSIDFIKVNNSLFHDNDGDYTFFEIQKLNFKRLDITNSTFNRTSTAFIRVDTKVSTIPVIVIDKTTINALGNSNNKWVLIDASANNPIDFTMKNSILANIPWESPRFPTPVVRPDLLRATAAGTTVTLSNNNFFSLNNTASPVAPLAIPNYVILSGQKSVDLGWTDATNTFTLPANSELRTVGQDGGPIGDPRWF